MVGGTRTWGTAAGDGRVALVCAKFNGGITERLLEGALAGLEAHGVKAATVTVAWVPGAFELPLAACAWRGRATVDAVVALGAVIRGETAHFDFVAGECAAGLQRVRPRHRRPRRLRGPHHRHRRPGPGPVPARGANKGYEAAVTALEMADLLRRLPPPSPPARHADARRRG